MSGWALVLLLALSCGKGAQSAAPTSAPEAPREGRVLLDNQTGYALEVAYLDAAERIVRTRVKSGGLGEVSGGLLPGGSEWTFDLVLLLPAELGYRVRRKAVVRIDDEIRVRARLSDPEDPFSLELETSGG